MSYGAQLVYILVRGAGVYALYALNVIFVTRCFP
jgi:hypothetical protein